jgi:hypothetical protein
MIENQIMHSMLFVRVQHLNTLLDIKRFFSNTCSDKLDINKGIEVNP